MSNATTGTATISHNTITGFQKNGITVDNTGSDATITHNTITGAGPTTAIAQNGIQVSRGATATVDHNAISALAYTGTDASSTGVLLFNPGAVTVDHNVVKSSDIGIDAFGAGAGSEITFNWVSLSTLDGIDVTDGSSVGVHYNHSSSNAADGIFTDVAGNSFSHNKMLGNGGFDSHDVSTGAGTAGTANTWTNNHCHTSSPAGLCAA
jgi:hypothetical protein